MLVVAAVFSFAVGAGLEIAQYYGYLGDTLDIKDVRINASGILTGVVVLAIFRLWKARQRA